MRKVLGTIAVLAVLVVTALPANAEHSDVDAFFDAGQNDAAEWNQSHTEHFCISPEFRSSGLGDAQVDNVVEASYAGAARWRTQTDINTIFNYGDPNPECGSNWSFEAGYANAQEGKGAFESVREDYCQHRGSQASSVQYEDLSWLDNRHAMAWSCDVDDNQVIDYFIVIIDPKSNMDFNDNGTTASNSYDYAALITHEMGHAYGFAIHWGDNSGACPENGNHNTMCSDGWGFYDGLGGTADSTLELHDIGEVDQNF